MRRSLIRLAASEPGRRGSTILASLLERVAPSPAGLLAVLTYHRVDEPDAHPELHPGLLSATPEGFDDQMRRLAAAAHPVGLRDVLAARRAGSQLPARAVLVTFDDAYADFDRYAWPILRRNGVPAVMFVPTAFPDAARPFWWDRLHHAVTAAGPGRLATPWGTFALDDGPRHRLVRELRHRLKSLPHSEATSLVETWCAELAVPEPPPHVLGWDALRRLAGEGLAVAPHTRNHPLLPRVDRSEAVAEVAGSLADLRARLGEAPPVLAYPSGAHDAVVRQAAGEAGIELAFTTDRGVNDLRRPTDWLALRRINVGRAASAEHVMIASHHLAARLLARLEGPAGR